MRTRSQAKDAMNADPGGGGGGRGEVKRKAKAAPMVSATQAAAGVSLVGTFGLEVDAAAEEVTAVEGGAQVEGNGMVMGDAAMLDAGMVGGVPVATDLLYETESAGMIAMEVDGDGSHVSIRVLNGGDGTKGEMGLKPVGLQSKVKGATEAVELSNCSAPHHIEAEPNNSDRFARYRLPHLDNGDLRVSDLVWSKIEGSHWWPGEIFYPSDASELALKHQIEGNYLVVYFGDGAFAWRDESQLMPFMKNYAQMEKECTSDDSINAVNHALEELSRRILSGMSCPCLPDELSDSGMSYIVENHGLKDGVTCSTANKAEVLKCFDPENLLQYVKSLALFPGQGGDLLELVVACSQLTSFYRSKGCPELASFQTYNGWDDSVMDVSSTMNVTMEEDVQNVTHSDHDTSERGEGRPNWKREDEIESMEKKETYNLTNSDIYNEFDDWQSRRMENSFKTGECKLQAASQLRGLSSFEKPQNEPMQNGKVDVSCYESGNELTVLKRAKWIHMHENDSAEPKELLPQLCSVAIEPLNKNICTSRIISYFSYYKNYVVTASTEVSITGNDTSRRGRTTYVDIPEVERTDQMQDSYWSGLSLQNDPIHSLDIACSSTMPKRKRKPSQEKCVPLPQHPQPATLAPKKHIHVMERSIIHFDAKIADELKPTALVLSFGRSAALPSELDLIKMFCRYGPLKESETEVHKDTNTAKVVFKKRVDAERGFSVVGNYSTFGPSLRSYRLVNMPFSLSA